MNYPILIVTYNRPERLESFLKKFSNTKRQIYVGVDKYEENVELAKKYLKNYKKIQESYLSEDNVIFIYSERHLGGKYSTPYFTSKVFELTEKLIIMDDDLIFNNDFLNYCDFSLDYFENDKNIYSIEGFNPFTNNDGEGSIFLTNYTLQLGWATWRNRWDTYSNDLANEGTIIILKNLCRNFKFDILSVIFWFIQIYKSEKRYVDAWDWYHFYNQFKRRTNSVIYSNNLVLHDGWGEESLNMHDKDNEIFKSMKLSKFSTNTNIIMEKDSEFEKKIKKRYFGISILGFIKKLWN